MTFLLLSFKVKETELPHETTLTWGQLSFTAAVETQAYMLSLLFVWSILFLSVLFLVRITQIFKTSCFRTVCEPMLILIWQKKSIRP